MRSSLSPFDGPSAIASTPSHSTDHRAPEPASWRPLLPALEQELADDLQRFRKTLRAARILPDWVNPDVFPRSRSGAWKIFADDRSVGGVYLSYTLYVRRSSAQLAVNENGGHPYVVTSTFTNDFPWAPPTAEELREAMLQRMRSLGLLTR